MEEIYLTGSTVLAPFLLPENGDIARQWTPSKINSPVNGYIVQ
jgi:hypothetical protein